MTSSLGDQARLDRVREEVMKKVLAAIVLAVTLAGLGVVTSEAPASAGARGCNTIRPANVGGLPVASGTYCVELNGSRRYVNYVGGGFNSAGNICNWQITAEFFNRSGRWYQTKVSRLHRGCTHRANDVILIRANKQPGFMCSTLRQNGGRVTSVCHNI